MDAFTILAIAIGLFGAAFAAFATLNSFFSGYIKNAWANAGKRLSIVKSFTKNQRTIRRAQACYVSVIVCSIVWRFIWIVVAFTFGYFVIFRFGADALECAEAATVEDTTKLYKAYVGYIESLLMYFKIVLAVGIISLVALLITDWILAGMSEMAETKATKERLRGTS